MAAIVLNLEGLRLDYARLRIRSRAAERRLLASLEEHGQQEPIVVAGIADGGYAVIDGYKRVSALIKLRADVVNAEIWDMPVSAALVRSYRRGVQRGLSAIEEGWLVAELVRAWPLSEVAARLSRSKSWVSRRLGLVEGLPASVTAAVQAGRIGAYCAARYLLPLARANAGDCAALAGKVAELSLSSRETGLLYRQYVHGRRAVWAQVVADPVRFLKAAEAARITGAAAGTGAEARCAKNLELLGNIAQGVTRGMVAAAGADEAARERLLPVWTRVRSRLNRLNKTGAAVFGKEADDAGQRNAEHDNVADGQRPQHQRDSSDIRRKPEQREVGA